MRYAMKSILVGSSLLLSFSTANAQSTQVLDSFSVDQALIQAVGPGNSASNAVSGSGIPGGERELAVVYNTGNNPTGVVSMRVEDGRLFYSQDTGVNNASGTITWDGTNGGISPSVDLTNADSLTLTIIAQDLPATYTLRITSGGVVSSQTRTNDGGIVGGVSTPEAETFDISGFTPAIANPGAITGIELLIVGNPALDLQLDAINAIITIPPCVFNPSIPSNSPDCVAPPQPQPVPGMTAIGAGIAALGLMLISAFARRRS